MSKLTIRLTGLFVLAFSIGLVTLLMSRFIWLQPAQVNVLDALDRAAIDKYQLAINAAHHQLLLRAEQLDQAFFDAQLPQGWQDTTFDAAWLLDDQQQLLIGAGKDPVTGRDIADDRLTLLLSQLLNQSSTPIASQPLWLNTPSGPALVVTARTDDGQQVIALQLWTVARINQWQKIWQLPLNALWLHDKSVAGNLRRAAAALQPYQQRSPVRMSDKLRWVVTDANENPLLLLEIDAPTVVSFAGFNWAQLTLLIGWIVALAVAAALVYRQFLRPQHQLRQALQQRNVNNDYHHPVAVDGGNGLARECNFMLRHIQQQDNRLLKLSHQVEMLSKTDTLTGLANRQRLEEFLEQEWARARQLSTQLCFGLCDLDMFKSFNERYGVALGDSALKEVARALEGNLHRATDLVARLSGATFAIVLTDTDSAGAKVVGAKLLQAVTDLDIAHADSEHRLLSVTLGCLCIQPDGKFTIEPLLAQANKALEQAKQLGGNRISVNPYKR